MDRKQVDKEDLSSIAKVMPRPSWPRLDSSEQEDENEGTKAIAVDTDSPLEKGNDGWTASLHPIESIKQAQEDDVGKAPDLPKPEKIEEDNDDDDSLETTDNESEVAEVGANRVHIRNRMSIRELETSEHAKHRYAFLRAFDEIKKLSHDHPTYGADSFWSIASINGQPFTSKRSKPPQCKHGKMWRGHSQHENVLFLPWYRAYLLRLEDALVRHAPVDNLKVALHYWDETSPESLANGLPRLLTDEFVEIDKNGNTIPNPLLGFTLPEAIPLNKATQKYTKAAQYTTCRYPFSGLMNPRDPTKYTANAEFQNHYLNLILRDPKEYLNQNIIHSLNDLKAPLVPIKDIYKECLDIEDYNKFSNISSAGCGNISLEHASISMLHTLGGNSEDNSVQRELIAGSHGDLGSKEMAAFDPLFFLHMSNVDRMFWIWQEKYHHTTSTIVTNKKGRVVSKPFKIKASGNGIKPNQGQGPSPSQQGEEILGMSTSLHPFKFGALKQPTVTNDLIDIKGELHYTYTRGSFDKKDPSR
ncbi:uncharacterized protein [Clytia hemisphaerica]|uniref:Tyrosinase copper-binding domain-containing protein n=1 Tax=Clytia hemisphaerica TaxID=252671 RepID=A0A7M5WXX0_9CNID